LRKTKQYSTKFATKIADPTSKKLQAPVVAKHYQLAGGGTSKFQSLWLKREVNGV
jgi:hypothetical protein